VSQSITVQEPGDVVWTMDAGRLRAWLVLTDGTLSETDPGIALEEEAEEARS
jgi:hypothetical protein